MVNFWQLSSNAYREALSERKTGQRANTASTCYCIAPLFLKIATQG